MLHNVQREDGYYHDESGEIFLQLSRDAQAEREAHISAVKVVIFWTAVIFVGCALVFAKLYTMGAVEGLK